MALLHKDRWYKDEDTDKVWWYDSDRTGLFLFSFDREKAYNLFRDYPWKLSVTEWMAFNKENEYWYDFFEAWNNQYEREHQEEIEKHRLAVEKYRMRRDGRVQARVDAETPYDLREREEPVDDSKEMEKQRQLRRKVEELYEEVAETDDKVREYFDLESDAMMEKKFKVLNALSKGKSPEEIGDDYFDILEGLDIPKGKTVIIEGAEFNT